MTTVTFEIPDDIADRAQEAGLLQEVRFTAWLKEELRLEAMRRLVAKAKELSDYENRPTPEEIQAEIDAVRREEK